VRIALLIINARGLAKLASRGISPSEVEQVRRNGPYVPANPHPRVPDSRLMIGPTDGGRMLTLVIQPDANDPGAWHVMTGWPSTTRERNAYQRNA
jgi:hypothetical protein